MNLGMPEMIFIFLMALVIFGPRKLPELGRQLGKALNEFKKASNEFKYQLESEIKQLDNGTELAATARDIHQTFSRPVGETVFNTLMNAASAEDAQKNRIQPPTGPVGTYPGSPGSEEAPKLATDPAAVQAAQAVAAEIEEARMKHQQREATAGREQASLFNGSERESNA